MSFPETSPASPKPFQARMRETMPSGAAHPEAAFTVHEYVLLAKLILLEHRVRDFSASDVVALAAIMEGRDRDLRMIARSEGDCE